MDSPAHFADGPGKWLIDDIPVERLIAEAVVIDIRYKADVETYPDATVSTHYDDNIGAHRGFSCNVLGVSLWF